MRETIRATAIAVLMISCLVHTSWAQSCTAAAGTLGNNNVFHCPDDSIQVSSTGAQVAPGYQTEYWLADSNRVFLAKASSTGHFEPRAGGKFFIYAFNYALNNPAEFPPKIDSTVMRVRLSSTGCFALSDSLVVVFRDQVPPMARCKNDTIYLNANGLAVLNPEDLNAGSTDNCGIRSFGATPSRFTCADIGPNEVTLSVRDSSNNVSYCSATVTVLDTMRPIAKCRDIEVFLDEEGQASILPSQVDDESIDNCGTIASLSLSQTEFDCGDLGVKELLLTATDRSGNQQTCVARVTVRDTIKPKIQCRTTTLFLGSDGQAILLPILINAGVSDNCSQLTYRLSRNVFNCSDRGETTVTLYVQDAAGNEDSCTTTITIVDQVRPSARCKNIQVYLDANGKAEVHPQMLDNGSTDNCSIDSFALDKTTFTCAEVGENLVTFTVYDAEGNFASCLAGVTVLDTLKPLWSCPNDLTIRSSDDGDQDCSYTVTNRRLDPTDLKDNCNRPRLSHDYSAAPSDTTLRGASFPIGTTVVRWTIEDVNGNRQTCIVQVTVRDILPPVPVCADTILVELGANGTVSIDSSTVDLGSYDNCKIVNFTLSKSNFNCQNVGFNLIKATLVDAAGNAAETNVVVGVVASAACVVPKIANAKGPKIGDPCSCRGNGAFDEEIVIGPSLPNQIWRVRTTTLRDSTNQRVYVPGTLFREVRISLDSSIYVLRGVHLDGQGYNLVAESPLFTQTLRISNLCNYPKPQLLDLDNPICLFTPPITLTGNAGMGVEGSATFQINNQAATQFNPRSLGVGTHQVRMTFDAGNPAAKLAPSNVGCSTTITKAVTVLSNSPSFSCHNDLSINVNSACEILITPDMLIVNKLACYDDYEVVLNFNGTLVPNPVPAIYAGRTLTGFIRFKPNPSIISCNTNITLRDLTGPRIIACPEDKTIGLVCTDFDSIFNNPNTIDPAFRNFMGRPEVEDNCTGTTITFTDAIITFANCHPSFSRGIRRTFTARDRFGNTSTCIQQFIFRRPTQLFFPKDTLIKTNCESAALPTDTQGNISAGVAGQPWYVNGFGKKVFLGSNSACDYSASYTDQRVSGCGTRYGLIRTWRIINWCNQLQSQEKTQLIEVGDFDAPIVSAPELDLDRNGVVDDTLRYGVAPFNCLASFVLPSPKIKDCSNTTTATEIYSWMPVMVGGFPIGPPVWTKLELSIQNGQVQNIPVGTHYFVFIVRDICNQETRDTVAFKVVDRIAPTMICNSDFSVSLGGGGVARILPADINKSSRDNCDNTNITLEIRRLIKAECNPSGIDEYSEWGSFADLTCCDVGKLATIELRGTDRFGNVNTCLTRLQVEDKIAPACTPPPNRTINCNDVAQGVSLGDLAVLQRNFGAPTVVDNCEATWEELSPILNLDRCGAGNVIRRFRAKDNAGNFSSICEQVITVRPVHNYEIKFPKDVTSYCGVPVPDSLLMDEIACDALAFNVEDRQFTVPNGGCYQIFRTYQVLNLCEYDELSTPTAPVIIGRDMDCDMIPGDEDIWLMVRPNGLTYLDKDNNESNSIPKINTRSRSCDGLGNPNGHWSNSSVSPGLLSRGFWQYTQIITVIDTTKPIINYTRGVPYCSNNSTTCDASVDLLFTVNENCTPGSLQITAGVDLNQNGSIDRQLNATEIQGVYPNYRIRGTYPIGTHAFVVQVRDACGNIANRTLIFSVVDCKAPAPICRTGITVTLQSLEPARDINGDGTEDLAYAVVKARDFIASPVADCSGPIRYSINREGFIPNLNQDSLILTCTDEGTVIVEVHAWDSANNPLSLQPDGRLGGPNYDFCLNFITVQNNGNICIPPPQGALGGTIMTESRQSIANVEVILSGQGSNRTTSGTNGGYVFTNLIEDNDYTLTPRLNTNHGNGVSTLDLLLIRRHILGIAVLDSPYKLIAADANNSKTVTTLDLILIQKVILNIDPAFRNNTSWRFIDANYRFPDPNNPWLQSFPETFSINNLTGQRLNASFIGIKIGDVNGSATLGFQEPELRSAPAPLWVEVEDQLLQAGQESRVAFRTKDLSQLQGYQLALQYRPEALELLDIQYGLAKPDNFGVFKSQGILTANWYTDQPHESGQDEVWFTLIFKAKQATRLSKALQLHQALLHNEAYNWADEMLPLALRFNEALVLKPHFELYPNIPNPFVESTQIRFYLPAPAAGEVVIFDAAGRQLKTIRNTFVQGLNVVEIDDADLPKGVLYYSFRSREFTATRKMIKH